MRKLVAVAAGSSALAATGFLSAGHASSDNGALDVSGNTYSQAVKILQSEGYKPVFQGSVGSDVPEPQCIVESQKLLPRGRVALELNCTKAAQPAASAAEPAPGAAPGAPGPPHVGANGVTTVTPTPVGPQPGMTPPG
ncbi:MAG: hypothetical protein JO191_02375 [Mycobacteriaceae bacterium]|nr:hypothetical protein [Mycobacteriaceae bacterium]